MPGRPPKSSQLLVLGKEKLYGKEKDRVDLEPAQKDESKKPVRPDNYTKPERKVWDHYCVILTEYGLLNLANGEIIKLLVRNVVDRDKCIEHIKTEGIVIQTARGRVHNPYFTAKNKCEENIIKYLNLLGLSSMGLAKLGCLQAEHKKEKDEMEDMLD